MFNNYYERKLSELIRSISIFTGGGITVNGELYVAGTGAMLETYNDAGVYIGRAADGTRILFSNGDGFANNWQIDSNAVSGAMRFFKSGVVAMYFTSAMDTVVENGLTVNHDVNITQDLHVVGNDLDESTAVRGVHIGRAPAGSDRIVFCDGAAANNWQIDTTTDIFRVYKPGAEKFRVQNDGTALCSGKFGTGGFTTPTVNGEFRGTDALLLPKGTTAQRPAGVDGYIRFNTDTNRVEAFYGGIWNNL